MRIHHGMGLREAVRIARNSGLLIREDAGELIFTYPGHRFIRVNRRRHDAPRELTRLIMRFIAG
jgi:hypothetical protein